ncbi:hypothetical protein EV426DRAFT_706685 [Tirmania nivea]|nr:hypothetical protein EV426DRAFT_706685 [Tirmania nivea]
MNRASESTETPLAPARSALTEDRSTVGCTPSARWFHQHALTVTTKRRTDTRRLRLPASPPAAPDLGNPDIPIWKKKEGQEEEWDAVEAYFSVCGRYDEDGHHVALVCGQGEWIGRRFGSWVEVDNLKRVVVKERVEGKEVSRDLAEDFFGHLRSC